MALAHHILVPTDFSEAAQPALGAAATLARVLGARVTLLHVFDSSSLGLGHVGLIPVASQLPSEADIEAKIRAALDASLAEHFAGIEGAETKLVFGAQPAEAIVDESENSGVDLIVMGTQGRSSIDKLLIGSVTERVVRHATCMTLVVPSPAG